MLLNLRKAAAVSLPHAYISPSFRADKFDNPTTDDLIDVYEDRILNWILRPAKRVAASEDGAPAGFCLLLTYYEGAWAYMTQTPSDYRSREFFVKCFVDVLASPNNPPALMERLAELLYRDARCGFFHDGLFRGNIFFAKLPNDLLLTLPKRDGQIDVDGEIQSVQIDVERCIAGTERHLSKFVAKLRDASNVDLRASFRAFFKSQCDWEDDGPVVVLK